MDHIFISLLLALHVLGGTVAMCAGLVAVCSRKGSRFHRVAGDVFVVAMLVMALFAAILGAVIPGQTINIFIAVFTSYLVASGWLAATRRNSIAGTAEKILLAVSLLLCAPFALLVFQIISGIKLFESAFTIEGPILVALSVFAGIIGLAAIGDLRVVFGRRMSVVARVTRHLWRMCFGLALSLGSAFTNGFARLLPGPYHVPSAFFMPQLLMLVVLLYWVVRVRFPGWAGKAAPSDPRGDPLSGF